MTLLINTLVVVFGLVALGLLFVYLCVKMDA